MIIHPARIDNPWHRAALGWPLAILLACVLAWPTLDYLDVEPMRLLPLAIAIPQGAFLLYKLGEWTRPPTRVMAFAAILGLFAYLPLLAALLVPLYTLLFLDANTGMTLAAQAALPALLVWWAAANVLQVRALVMRSEFFERAFNVESDRIVLDRAQSTALATARLDAVAWAGSLLAFAIPMSYLLAHLAMDSAGPRATLLQVAALATPLAIHVLGRLARGTYVWIYRVRQLERKHGKPVHLAMP